MNPASVDLKTLLVSAGLGTFGATSGWGIYISEQPDAPDTTITLWDTGGSDPNPALALDQPTVMIWVRGPIKDYAAGYAKAMAVKNALLGIAAQTINSTPYGGATMRGDIAFLQYDEKSRPLFTLNFHLWREPPAAGTYRRSI